ncbi:MAG: hypothetical protein AAFR99_18750, partial [Cyanobacteria bacterium J06629_9]
MKRHGSLWPQITDFENLLLASRKAQKAKRFRDNVLAFNYHLETELLTLQQELTAQTYQPGPYRNFEIFEPKRRLISAAPYRDRVVHHALCNVMVPLLDPMFIDDCYANRTGYGSHRALRRFTRFARSSKYVLQCDISKYFPSKWNTAGIWASQLSKITSISHSVSGHLILRRTSPLRM